MTIKTILFAAAMVVSAASAMAADPVCTGSVATVRISKLTPTGTMAGFEKAIADHAAWYKSHGDATQVVFVQNADKLVSVTIHPSSAAKMPEADDAYKTFVKEYNANSEIVLSGSACLTDAEALYKKQHQ